MKIIKSIQGKLLLFYITIILIFGYVLGLVLVNSYLSNLQTMRKNDVIACAEQISEMFADGRLTVNDLDNGMNIPVLMTAAKNFSARIQVVNPMSKSIFYDITDTTVRVLDEPELISEDIYRKAYLDNDIYSDIHEDSETSKKYLTVGFPMHYHSSALNPWAILVINSDLQSVYDTCNETLLSLFIPLIIIALVGVGAIIVITQSMIRRIKRINSATEKIARGKLDERVIVQGNDEISYLAENFNIMARAIEKSDSTMKDFVSNAAHELRSPMTSINGFVEGMLDGTIPPEKNKKYLEIVLSETKRLTNLVKVMLDLSRIESGRDKINLTKFDINETVRRVIIRLSQKFDTSGVIPEIDFENESQLVLADCDKIEQVLQNLIDNAIKFTPSGNTVKISTAVADKKVKVCVSDTGKGISEEDIKRIWDRFFTEDKSHNTGTGLGLPIVKSIIEQHNEIIKVESRVGEGTTFIFTISKA